MRAGFPLDWRLRRLRREGIGCEGGAEDLAKETHESEGIKREALGQGQTKKGRAQGPGLRALPLVEGDGVAMHRQTVDGVAG